MMLYLIKVGFGAIFDDCDQKLVFPDEKWLQQVACRGLCPQCRCIDRKCYPVPVDIVLGNVPEGETSIFVETTGVTVWRREFVEILSKYEPGIAVGKCLGPDSDICANYVTAYLRRYITIRGNKQSRYQICRKCRTILSNVEPGPKYVLKQQLTEAKIYQDTLCRFYVTEDIADDFDPENFNFANYADDISLEAISIREAPSDGQPFQLVENL